MEGRCFHHTDRETGRSCTRCDRAACADCLTPAAVGAHCWQCLKAARPPARERVRRWNARTNLLVTHLVIAANLTVFVLGLIEGASALGSRGGSLFGGSFGAVLLRPEAHTAGASGAVFGLLGAAAVGLHLRGVDIWRTPIGTLVVLNVLMTFALPGISIGGHLGGLAGGGAGRRRDAPRAGDAGVDPPGSGRRRPRRCLRGGRRPRHHGGTGCGGGRRPARARERGRAVVAGAA
jgi:hypothetical protein